MFFLKKHDNLREVAGEFSKLFVMINQFELSIKTRPSTNKIEIEEDLFTLAYLCRNRIINKMPKGGWMKSSRLTVPKMATQPIKISFAYRRTINRVRLLGKQLNVDVMVEDILNQGDFYDRIHERIPCEWKLSEN